MVGSPDPVLVNTPDANLAQQQLFLHLVLHYAFGAGLNISDPTQVAGAVTQITNFYAIAWPLVQTKDFNV